MNKLVKNKLYSFVFLFRLINILIFFFIGDVLYKLYIYIEFGYIRYFCYGRRVGRSFLGG